MLAHSSSSRELPAAMSPPTFAFDAQPNEAFEDLARLATYICHVPVALIGFAASDERHSPDHHSRYWIKAAIGLEPDRFGLCLDLCELIQTDDALTCIEDLQDDPRFAERPFIATAPYYRFYAGIPLVTPKGTPVGSLCVLDYEPRQLDRDQVQALQTLSRQATRSLRALREFGLHFRRTPWSSELPTSESLALPTKSPVRYPLATRANSTLPSYGHIVEILESITEAFFAIDRQWNVLYLNHRAEKLWNVRKADLSGRNFWECFPHLRESIFAEECFAAFQTQTCRHFEEYYDSLGVWLEVRLHPEPNRLSVYFRDVTSYKQNENVLLERTHLSALITAVSAALAQSQTLAESLELCMEAIAHNLDTRSVALWLIRADDPDTHTFERSTVPPTLTCHAADGEDFPELLFPKTTGDRDSFIDWVARLRQPYINSRLNEARDPDGRSSIPQFPKLLDWAHRCGVVGLAGYPLLVEDRLLGVLVLCGEHPWTQDCTSVLNWVTSGIALSVDRAWARDALVNRRKSLLFRLAGQIRNSLDLDTILDTAVHEIRTLLQIDRCYYLWCSSQNETPRTLAVTHEACTEDVPSFLGESFMSQADRLVPKIWQLETVQLDNIDRADEATRQFLEPLGVASQLVLPLGTRAGQFGAIACSHSSPRPWTETEVELLQAVVDQLAIAIDQAELYAKTCAAALAAQTQAQQLQEAMEHLKQTEAQLIQHEKMSSLGQMVAGIAHEINNPVNFITGNISHATTYIEDLLGLIALYQERFPEPPEDIEEEIEDIDLEFLQEDLPKLLDSMQMGAERIRQIVLSLRNFSRLDEAEVKPVNLHEGLENTLLILHTRLKGKGDLAPVRAIKYYGDLPKVACFPGLLNQVFMNVIANAIDAVEDAGKRQPDAADPATITICTEALCSGKTPRDNAACDMPDSVVVRIRDNGSGIKAETVEKLFDPFFTTKPVGKGTGLGLSIGYQIVVEKHGGRLWCESEVGKGTEFFIQIPIEQPELDR